MQLSNGHLGFTNRLNNRTNILVTRTCVVHETCRLNMHIDMSIHALARELVKKNAKIIRTCLLIKHFYSWGHTFYDLLRWIAMIDF